MMENLQKIGLRWCNHNFTFQDENNNKNINIC